MRRAGSCTGHACACPPRQGLGDWDLGCWEALLCHHSAESTFTFQKALVQKKKSIYTVDHGWFSHAIRRHGCTQPTKASSCIQNWKNCSSNSSKDCCYRLCQLEPNYVQNSSSPSCPTSVWSQHIPCARWCWGGQSLCAPRMVFGDCRTACRSCGCLPALLTAVASSGQKQSKAVKKAGGLEFWGFN